MVFTLAGHGVDQSVEVLMALRGGALEGQIFGHRESGGRQDGMCAHDDLRGDRGTTGGTRHGTDRHGTRARRPASVPPSSTWEDQRAYIGAATGRKDSQSWATCAATFMARVSSGWSGENAPALPGTDTDQWLPPGRADRHRGYFSQCG